MSGSQENQAGAVLGPDAFMIMLCRQGPDQPPRRAIDEARETGCAQIIEIYFDSCQKDADIMTAIIKGAGTWDDVQANS